MPEIAGMRGGRPIRLGPVMPHVWMVKRMAQTTGVDLAEAMHEDRLTHDDWADMVTRCRGCDWGTQCSDWLAKHEVSKTTPTLCENRVQLGRLRAQSGA